VCQERPGPYQRRFASGAAAFADWLHGTLVPWKGVRFAVTIRRVAERTKLMSNRYPTSNRNMVSNQDVTMDRKVTQGKELLAVASLFFIRSVVWFAFDYRWPRHPDKVSVLAAFAASMMLAAFGILLWRSALCKLGLMDYVIVITCTFAPVLWLFGMYA